MWGFLNHYKDIILNGLDLLSFLLATPELLKHVAGRYIYATALFCILFIGSMGALVSFVEMSGRTTMDAPLVVFMVVLIGAMFMTGWLLTGNKASDQIVDAVRGNAFTAGVVIFIGSRLLAFTIAGHELAMR